MTTTIPHGRRITSALTVREVKRLVESLNHTAHDIRRMADGFQGHNLNRVNLNGAAEHMRSQAAAYEEAAKLVEEAAAWRGEYGEEWPGQTGRAQQ